MGNTESSPRSSMHGNRRVDGNGYDNDNSIDDSSSTLLSFPGSALVDAALQCGNIKDSGSFDDNNGNGNSRYKASKSLACQLLSSAQHCVMSPTNSNVVERNDSTNNKNINNNGFNDGESTISLLERNNDGNQFFDNEYEEFGQRKEKNSNNNATTNSNTNIDQSSSPRAKEQEQQQHQNKINNTSQNTSGGLLAKALSSEVNKIINPNTMTPAEMVEREKKLLKAQEKARQHNLELKNNNNNNKNSSSNNNNNNNGNMGRPIGSPGEGVGQPSVLGSIAHALTGNYNDPLSGTPIGVEQQSKGLPPNSLLSEHRATQVEQRASGRGGGIRNGRNTSPSSITNGGGGGSGSGPSSAYAGKYTVTIGLSLSRRSSALGHPDTVTRQTAFDFNELQDREYKYVSSTDSSGWRAGGGERGGAGRIDGGTGLGGGFFSDGDGDGDGDGGDGSNTATTTDHNGTRTTTTGAKNIKNPGTPNGQDKHKVAAPDTVHIPIIHIDAGSPQVVDAIVSALARGEIFIPHMAIIPEALSVNGVSPPNLVVRFGTERNEDIPPDEWPNWCLEFMHNQLYEYFYEMGARWMKRPFSITLAKKVRWKTVKHMNRYFAHAERVIDAWREKGPQYLDPQLAYIEGGATPEEVGRSHGIYLLRNGIPTNYFAPNFDPPYTTKMTRSLLLNVLGKSWDKKRREWTSTPIPKLITPSMLVTAMCGCAENPANIGFMATEATVVNGRPDRSTMVPDDTAISSVTPAHNNDNNETTASPLSPQKHKKNKNKKERKQDMSLLMNNNNSNNNKETTATANVVLTPLITNEMYRMRTEKATTPHQQQQQQQVRLQNDNNVARSPQETVPDHFEGKLELQISSSSASFFDNSDGGIPSPKVAALQQEMEAIATAAVVASKRQESEQKQHNLLQVRVGGGDVYQDKAQWKQQPKQQDGNDENSGDSKNHRDHVFEGQIIDNKHQQNSISNDKKYKKKDAAAIVASDEDWLNDLGEPIHSKRSKDPIGSYEVEQQRHVKLIAMADVQSNLAGGKMDPLCDAFRDSTLSPTVRSNNSRSSSRNAIAALKVNNSGSLSMDYSKDDTLLTNGDNMSVGELTYDSRSILLGQQYTADSSPIASKATNEPRDADPQNSDVTRQYMAEQSYLQEVQEGNRSAETEEDATVYEDEPAPSDEVLFAAGWAKTLDPNSGSYYYFTLDRTQTVWDNPLAPPTQSYDDDDYDGSI